MKSTENLIQQIGNPFAILKPVNVPAPKKSPSILQAIADGTVLRSILRGAQGPMALDIETKGSDVSRASSIVVGLAIADERGSWYFDFNEGRDVNYYQQVLSILAQSGVKLIAHNLFFDGAFLYRDSGNQWKHKWAYCTYALYKHLATEGFPGQEWGLKAAQKDLLGWEDTNEVDLDQWLIDNGYFYSGMTNGVYGPKPKKAEMWRAPSYILGKYCALDAWSTWAIYNYCFLPALNKFPALDAYEKEFLGLIKKLVEQQVTGVKIDVEALTKYHGDLKIQIESSKVKFLEHESVSPHIEESKRLKIEEHKAKEPAKYKKQKPLGMEPDMTTKAGRLSKNWQRWNERKRQLEAEGPAISKNWERWKEQLVEIENSEAFNLNSGQQLQWLFYERLKNEVLFRTKSGQPATDKKACQFFGEPGLLLKKYNDEVKEESYVSVCLEKVDEHGVIHVQARVPGTLTGRLAGAGGLNFQQLPKSKGYLSCWVPRPGNVFVDCDFTSLEQVVLAELSRDVSLWNLYGPNAKPNDVYLFTGSSMPIIGEAIRAAGYDRDNPTVEGIANAKKKAKKERSIAKAATLGFSYGMGAGKLVQQLVTQGVKITNEQAYGIHEAYWKLYSGVKDYEKELLRQWKLNKGWVLNGIGRPLGIWEERQKDIVNRVVQSTGHDVLVFWVNILERQFKAVGIDYRWVFADFHDQAIVEVPREQAEATATIMGGSSMNELNGMLQGKIPLTGDAQIVENLAEAKIED